jgi:hypothetical protein
MTLPRHIALIIVCYACFAAPSLNGATIPAGTTLSVSTASSVTSQDPVGRTFTAQLDQDVAANGKVVVKAGTKASGKITASRANPRKNEALSLELTSISVNGRNVAVRTDAVQPEVPTTTGRQARRGHTAGTFTLRPGSKLQFRLSAPVTL